MLWKKESDSRGALYVNLFDSPFDFHGIENVFESSSPLRPTHKDSKRSLEFRKQGNDEFAQKDFIKAMELYNQSLCFAENDSEIMSLAYANRSACFLHLKMYEECLVDIQLAKDANYPMNLMSKLNKRKAECLKLMEAAQQRPRPYEPKLSFAANEKIPCMADILKIEKSNEFGKHITTTADIATGQTILVEKAFVAVLKAGNYERCANCMKPKKNFIACKQCPEVMFCSGKCTANGFHNYECDMNLTIDIPDELCDMAEGLVQFRLRMIVRSIIIGINTFSTIDEMMQFVKACNAIKSGEIAENINTKLSKYQKFFLHSGYDRGKGNLGVVPNEAFVAILSSPSLGVMFKTEAKRRFLKHLIVHHSRILQISAYDMGYGPAVNCVGSDFNHSCLPNVLNVTVDKQLVFRAIQPIKKGEQVFVSYLGDGCYFIPASDRRDMLLRDYNFECKCLSCKLQCPPFEKNAWLKTEKCFEFAMFSIWNVIKDKDEQAHSALKQRCIDFLDKYGLLICEEIIQIQHILCDLMQIEMFGYTGSSILLPKPKS